MKYIPLLKKLFVVACLFCIGNRVSAQTFPPIDQLKPGEKITVIYQVTVNAGTPSGTVLSNTATVTANNATTASSNTVNLNVVTCPIPTISVLGSTTFCSGGSVTLTAMPGDPLDPAQSYQWYRNNVPIAGTQTITVTQSGNYYVEITDNCVSPGTVSSTTTVVTVNPLPTATISSSPSPICFGGTSSLTFTTTGASPVTVTYSNGVTTNNVTVTGGVATVTVAPTGTTTYSLVSAVDANTCSQAQTGLATVTVNPLPTATLAGTGTVCIGGSATMNFTVTGAGTITVTFKDKNNTNYTASGTAGTITGTVTPPTAGTYTYTIVSVTDANNCSNTGSGTFTLTVNPLPTATFGGTLSQTVCAGTPVSVTINLTGSGTYTVTYAISNGSTSTPTTVTSSSNTLVITTPPVPVAGTYSYTVTNVTDGNGCSNGGTGSATVIVKTCLSATISGNQSICFGNTATLTFSVTGNGTVTVTYADSQGGVFTTTGTQAGSPFTVTRSGLSAGTHTFTIVSEQDQNITLSGGTGSATVVVNPLPDVNQPANQIVCANGQTATVTFSSSVPNTIFTWTNNNTSIGLAASGTGTITSFTAINTGAGPVTATITVTPSGGGSASKILLLYADGATPPNTLRTQLLALPGVTQVDLFNGQTGTPTLSLLQGYNIVVPQSNSPWLDQVAIGNNLADYIDGGGVVVALNFDWFGGAQSITGRWKTGNYTPFVDPGTGNFSNGSLGTFTPGHPLMQGVNTLNGFFRETIVVAPGATQVAAWNDGSPLIAYKGRAVGINAYLGDAPNNYSGDFARVIVNSAYLGGGLCTGTPKTFTITVNPSPHATMAGNATVCSGAPNQPVTFTGANGTSPYTFTYTVTNGAITSTLSATSSAGSNTATVIQPTVPAGTYTYTLVSVSDANTCTQAQTGTVTVQVNPLPTATFGGTTSQTICSGSAATFTATLTGTGNYTITYQYSNGASTIATTVTVTGNTLTITVPPPIAAGTYTFTITNITDGNGCSNTGANTATLTINQLPTATINGMSVVNGTLGAGDGVLSADVIQNGTSSTCSLSKPFPGTFAATYYYDTYTYKNTTASAQCVSVTYKKTAGSSPVEVIAYLNSFDPSNLATNYLADRGFGSGGGAPLTYSFMLPANTSVVLLVTEVSLHSGADYTITVSGLPALPAVTKVCQFSTPAPQVTFTGTAGTPPYTFNYSVTNGTTTTNTTVTTTSGNTATVAQSTAVAGTFTYTLVSVQDGNGCSQAQTGTVTIVVTSQVTGVLGTTNITCFGGSNGSINVSSVTGGFPPYTFSDDGINYISQPSSGPTFTGLSFNGPTGNIYNIYARDALGCTWPLGTATITQPPAITSTITQGAAITCVNPTTTLTITAGGGTGTYTYSLDGGAPQGSNILTAGIGNHTVTVTDAVGCQLITPVTINGTATISFNSVVITNNTCYNGISGQIAVRATGAGTPITYTLTAPGGSTSTQTAASGTTVNFTALAAGSYTITAVDNTNCPAVTIASVSQPAASPALNNTNNAPDLLLTSVINPPTATFNPGSTVTITYTISVKSNGNIAAQGVILRISKPFSGYTITLTPGSGNTWTLFTDNTLFTEFQLKPGLQIPCSGSMSAVIMITRAGFDSSSPGLPVTASVRLPGTPQDQNDFDNARSATFRVQ